MKPSYIVIGYIGVLVLILVVLGTALFRGEAPGYLSLYVLDVGQGDALLITEGDTQVLVDGGPHGDVLVKELTRILPAHDRTIELVILTHPQADHMAGLVDVLERYSVVQVLTPGVAYDSALFGSWQETLREKRVPVVSAHLGQVVHLGHAALQILYPFKDFEGVLMGSDEVNDASLVLKLVYGATTALLTGDAGIKTEFDLVRARINLESSILKAGHHGSRTSSSSIFLNAVDPRIALISLGKNNTFGHPHKEVLDRFHERGVVVYRTDRDQTIHMRSNGVRWCEPSRSICAPE